ncbi:Phenylpropanoylacetyl-CoA synthase [Colletotrichum tanaceti]|uniref:Phenylpropanoylacetyl-CoA synthase n=1 Tax=Colletotrichum tanaceti TaxID=1306861 RepID=A0A4U6XPJ8_9PEZI|nr:Phenylpropanoylacetyl-CoA synthase [Colletotrichum tanaceti]TKW57717.1 Phenylpropanoylacetyl-CoA synthase [Colletotrichum tanaceti]
MNGAHVTPPRLWITGLASQYPPYLLGPEKLDEFAKRFYDVEKPGLKKLLQINKTSGIETRACIADYHRSGFASRPEPPSIDDLDRFYRQAGVDLAAQACRKAMKEWGGRPSDMTHTVAVACTNQGNPGYDLLVARRLALPPAVDRTLLHGVGCAGGLAIMRAAAQIAGGAASRGRPARVLCFASELCTPNVRHDLAAAEACADPDDVSIAGVLFADGAAAFVLCNDDGLRHEVMDDDDDDDDDSQGAQPLFQLLEWDTATILDTTQHMGFYPEPTGFRTVLTRDVPSFTKTAIEPMFRGLLAPFRHQLGLGSGGLDVADFDWALHPGGEAIISGAQETMHLTSDQLRATREIYRTRGNSSSPTVLAVLDLLRNMGRGKEYVVATSFGPGITIEMSLLRRCRANESHTIFD